ncbi:hypothetical protein [Emticicia sp.]|uniref:hypothetical protein n=1 Tax=Emticicia sp. TaxID=1930953 RepID=UPI003BAB01C7
MRNLMIVLQVLGGFTLVPWFIIAGLSFMVFDTPKSIRKLFPWIILLTIFSYPFVLAASYWRAWSSVSIGNYTTGCLWSCLPIIVFAMGYLLINQQTDLLNRYKKN